MQSTSLEFEILYNNKPFFVAFESESPEKNFLMNVVYDGFELDTTEIRRTHPELYSQIQGAMANNASSYWEDDTMALTEDDVTAFANILNRQYKKIHSL